MKTLSAIALVLVFAQSTFAQAATVSVFGAAATDPNIASPLATAIYVAPLCGQPFLAETPPPIVNPVQGEYPDPANATKDCVVTLTAQLATIPVGTGYKAALKLGGGAYGPFSTAFAVAAQTIHPCDGTPATSSMVIAGARTISWCFSGLDTNGAVTTVTSWALYTNNVRSVLTGVTVGATANAAGLKLFSAPLTVAAGSPQYAVAGVNAVGEAAKSPVFTVQATPAGTAPATSVIRGVQ